MSEGDCAKGGLHAIITGVQANMDAGDNLLFRLLVIVHAFGHFGRSEVELDDCSFTFLLALWQMDPRGPKEAARADSGAGVDSYG